MRFALYVRNDNRRARLVKLITTCGGLDIDDPQLAIRQPVSRQRCLLFNHRLRFLRIFLSQSRSIFSLSEPFQFSLQICFADYKLIILKTCGQ